MAILIPMKLIVCTCRLYWLAGYIVGSFDSRSFFSYHSIFTLSIVFSGYSPMVTGLFTFLYVLHGFTRFHRFDYFSLVPCRLLILQHYTFLLHSLSWNCIRYCKLHTTVVGWFVPFDIRFVSVAAPMSAHFFFFCYVVIRHLSLFFSILSIFFLHYTLSHSFHSFVCLPAKTYLHGCAFLPLHSFSATATKPNRTILVRTIGYKNAKSLPSSLICSVNGLRDHCSFEFSN